MHMPRKRKTTAEQAPPTSIKEMESRHGWLKRAVSSKFLHHEATGWKGLVGIWRVAGSTRLQNLAVRSIIKQRPDGILVTPCFTNPNRPLIAHSHLVLRSMRGNKEVEGTHGSSELMCLRKESSIVAGKVPLPTKESCCPKSAVQAGSLSNVHGDPPPRRAHLSISTVMEHLPRQINLKLNSYKVKAHH
eukprot:1149783-Pelagomonas_calceolata.AAC.2